VAQYRTLLTAMTFDYKAKHVREADLTALARALSPRDIEDQ